MHRRYNLAHLILASVVALVLTPLRVSADEQAQIVFVSERDGPAEIYVMDADGRNQRRLTTNVWEDWDPSWSPDGERIVFASQRHGSDEIYVMDADGSNQQRLTEDLDHDWDPSWSPDGERIVFMSDRNDNFWDFGIYVMDADGGGQRKLTKNRQDDFSPAWFDPTFAVEIDPFAVVPAGKKLTMWGGLKQIDK